MERKDRCRRGKRSAWRRRLGILAAVASMAGGVVHVAGYIWPQHLRRAPTPAPANERPYDRPAPGKDWGPGRCGEFKYWRDGRCRDRREL